MKSIKGADFADYTEVFAYDFIREIRVIRACSKKP